MTIINEFLKWNTNRYNCTGISAESGKQYSQYFFSLFGVKYYSYV